MTLDREAGVEEGTGIRSAGPGRQDLGWQFSGMDHLLRLRSRTRLRLTGEKTRTTRRGRLSTRSYPGTPVQTAMPV